MDKNTNIVIATGIFPPDIGGPATYSQCIADEFVQKGYTVTVVTYGREKETVLEKQIGLEAVPRSLPKGIRHLVYFWKIFRKGRGADVIYAQDPVSVGLPAVLAALLLGKRFVLKVVGDYAWEQGVQRFGVSDLLDAFLAKPQTGAVKLLQIVEFFVARRACFVIVPSNYLKTVVQQWGVRHEKIVVVPNAVDITAHSDLKMRKNKHPVFLSVGRLVPWKGFEMLIQLMRSFPDAHLVIVGEGPEYQTLQSLVKTLPTQNVELAGKKTKEELLQLFRESDIFLLNTGYEGFSHQLLEAMAIGIPIITTQAGGNNELIQDGKNALVARYNQKEEWERAIKRILEEPVLQKQLIRNAKQTALRFTTERMIQKTLLVLQQ